MSINAGPLRDVVRSQLGHPCWFALRTVTFMLSLAVPALVLVVPSGGSAPYHVLAVIGLMTAVFGRPKALRQLHSVEKLSIVGYATFAVGVIVSVAETGFSYSAARELDVMLRPLWAIPILLLFLRLRMDAGLLWWGAAIGSVVAGCTAVYDLVVSDVARAEGGTSALTFGNTALLMGTIALIGYRYFTSLGRVFNVIPYLAFLAGIIASFLSGSRGGWLALPLLIGLVLYNLWRSGYRRQCGVVASVVVLVTVFMVIVPRFGVVERAELAFVQFNQYFDESQEFSPTSVSIRLELWGAAKDLFLEAPVFGGGIGYSFNEHLKEEVEAGNLHSELAKQAMPHNVFLDTLAFQGFMGIAALLTLWGCIGNVFIHALRSSDPTIYALGAAGVGLLGSYVIYGLTESVMGYGPPLVVFSFYSVLIVHLIGEERQRNRSI